MDRSSLEELKPMRNIVTLSLTLLVCLGSLSLAQNSVLATQQGRQLTAGQLQPAFDVLTFLAQSDLNPSERHLITNEFVAEFQADPKSALEGFQAFADIKTMIQSTADPAELGLLRQKLLAGFYQEAQSSGDVQPDFYRILFEKAPIVAYDGETGIVLTQPDLLAGLVFLQKVSAFEGTQFTDQELEQAGAEALTGFTDLDLETQQVLASGTIYLSYLQSNLQNMNQVQKTNVTNHYRTTIGGPPGNTRAPKESAFAALTRLGPENQKALTESITLAGGSSDYWKNNPQP